MAVRIHTLMTIVLTATLASGCSLTSMWRDEPRSPPPEPLAAVPAGSVTGEALPPPSAATAPAATAPGGLAALDATQQTGTAPPSAAADASGVGRTDLLGGWTISSAGDSCQLFMTLTTWAGGYRASTKNCKTATLQTVSAWNMEGGQVQLLNDAGTTIARLYPQSKTQFSGTTEGGGPITVSR